MNKRLSRAVRGVVPRGFWCHLPPHLHLGLLRSGSVGRMLAIVPERRVAYVCIPKVANNTIRRYLLAASGEVRPAERVMRSFQNDSGGLATPEDFPPAELRAILRGPAWFRFTFVRNPYARLVSAYKDKVLGLGEMDERAKFLPRLGAAEPMPFRDFILIVCRQSDEEMDAHWRPQRTLLMEEAIDYTHVGRLESFRADMRPVVERLALAAGVVAELESRPINRARRAPVSGPFAAALDASLAEQVFRRYRGDFERFGYPMDSWRTPDHPASLRAAGRPTIKPCSPVKQPAPAPEQTFHRQALRGSPNRNRIDR